MSFLDKIEIKVVHVFDEEILIRCVFFEKYLTEILYRRKKTDVQDENPYNVTFVYLNSFFDFVEDVFKYEDLALLGEEYLQNKGYNVNVGMIYVYDKNGKGIERISVED
jgi:hypothetical protein